MPEILPRAPGPLPLLEPWQARQTLPGLLEAAFSLADLPLPALAFAPGRLAETGLSTVRQSAAAASLKLALLPL